MLPARKVRHRPATAFANRHSMNLPARILLCSLMAALSAPVAPATVTTVIRYPLGESGSLGANNMPLDSIGGYNLLAQINGAGTFVVTNGLGAGDSTAALRFNGINQGFYGNGGDMNVVIGTDNFGVELWVRTPDITQEGYDFIFSLTGDTTPPTGPAIHLANGRWSASIPGYQWIGGNPFVAGGGVPAVANVWTRLAVVRTAGVFRLYVNGVAHPETTNQPPVGMNGFHMAVNPGGATYFEGDIDEVRVFTFTAGAFDAATDLYQPAEPPITDFSGQAVISEIAASGTAGMEDADGTNADWIELMNPPTAHVQLNGWRLSDDPLLPAKWKFPATILAPVMGRVRSPHGLKGWVKIQPFTQEVEGLLDYPEWWLGGKGQWQQHRIAESAVHGSIVVARLEGFADRDAAAALRGSDVAVPRDVMPENREGEFYWNDLLGMEVSDRTAAKLGVVAKFLETGANPVIVVMGDNKEFLVPFIEGVIVNVDLKARQLVVDWEPV